MSWTLLLLQDEQGHDHHAFKNIKVEIQFVLIQADQTKSFLAVMINSNSDYCSLTVRVLHEVISVHESTTKSPTNTPLWLLPRLPHEEAHHSTHTYLASFRSVL